MIDWDRYRLPPNATRADRVTFQVWKLWHGWVRGTLRLAMQMAFGLIVALAVAMLLWDSSFFGAWGLAAAVAVALGVLAGSRLGGKAADEKPVRFGRSPVAAALVALPLALVLAAVASISVTLLVSFIIVPVVNYGLPALLLVGAAAVGIGRLIKRWRERENARYPADPA